MANSQSEKVHYIVSVDRSCYTDGENPITHIYAANAEEAVRLYVNGDNPLGWEEDEWDLQNPGGMDVYAVPASQVIPFVINLNKVERVDVEVTKGKKGTV